MRRREFLCLVAGVAVSRPLAARAQQRLSRVGILLAGTVPDPHDFELVHELARIGYVDGHNISYLFRGADRDSNRLPRLARELVATNPDVIVGSTSAVAVALAAATRHIPIVMTVVGDPVVLGLSDSMSRPSRNVTGFTISSVSLTAKRIELLHELIPGLRKVGYVYVPGSPLNRWREEQVRMAVEALGINLVLLPLKDDLSIEAAFSTAEKERVSAVLIESDGLTLRYSSTIIDECLVRELPAMHSWPFEVHNGALIGYGPTKVENFPRTAIYVDRILKGARIVQLPFEEPTHFKLAINLRTARSIKISVPPMLLARAEEVVE